MPEPAPIQPRSGAIVPAGPSQLERDYSDRRHQGEVLQQSRFWARSITWALVGTTAFGLGWLALARTEEIIQAPGKLAPVGQVVPIQVPVGGVVKHLLVKEGQRVKAGEVLLRLDKETSMDRQQSLHQTIALKREQLSLKNEELNRYLDLNTTQQEVLRENLAIQRDLLKRYQGLAEQGATAEVQFLDQKNKVQQVEGNLQQTTVDRRRQVALLQQEIQQLRSELADMGSKLTETDVNIRYQDVRSPVNGVVFELKPTNAGFVAQGSEPLLKVVPFDNLQAMVEIASKDIGFVRVGQLAEISIDSFPAHDFGTLEGKVSRIGSDALPPDAQKGQQDYRFPAVVKLSSQRLKVKNGQSLPLQVGMSLKANIKLRKVSYLQLLLGSFRDKTDSLRRI